MNMEVLQEVLFIDRGVLYKQITIFFSLFCLVQLLSSSIISKENDACKYIATPSFLVFPG